MAIQTRWNWMAVAAFEATFRPWMRRNLSGIYITGLPERLPANTSVILAANHVSWWDGFLLRELQRRTGSSHPLLTIMGEDQLRRFPFFRLMGTVGIQPTPSATRDALRQVARLRADGPLWLSFFPQGRIWPSWKQPLGFSAGITRFAQEVSPAIVLPVGIHLEPLANPAPTAFVAVSEGVAVEPQGDPLRVEAIEESVSHALLFIRHHLAEHGESAPDLWPALHAALSRPAQGALRSGHEASVR